MIRVLFVCLGNICRSPMAEAVFRHLVKNAGLENEIEADSAGCGDWHMDSTPHPGTQTVLKEAGIEYSGTARRINIEDLTAFDYIITMDDENLRFVQGLECKAACPTARIAPLLEFAPLARQHRVREVPDPYLVGGFDVVFRLVHAGCTGLLEEIRREHGL
jgi:protein-tyrosine phosphatase